MPSERDITDQDLGVEPGSLGIDMVELGHGCVVNCRSCGAFEAVDDKDKRVVPITIEQLEANLAQEIVDARTGTRFRLVELLKSFITPGVDMEPLGVGIFPEAAELIYRLSGGRSRLVTISHGLSCFEKVVGGKVQYKTPDAQRQKLQEIIQLMLRDIVPVFVLTMDSARQQGLPNETAKVAHAQVCEMDQPGSRFMRIIHQRALRSRKDEEAAGESERLFEARKLRIKRELLDSVRVKMQAGLKLDPSEVVVADYINARNKREEAVVENNARGYAETLYVLLPAIGAGKRVTISLQGDNDKGSLAYYELATRIQQRTADLLCQEYGMSAGEVNALFNALNITPPRPYAGVGRAHNLLGVETGTGKCPIVPDPGFIRAFMDRDPFKVARGRIRVDGTLEVQANRPGENYTDTVDDRDNPWRVVRVAKKAVYVATGELTLSKGSVELG